MQISENLYLFTGAAQNLAAVGAVDGAVMAAE